MDELVGALHGLIEIVKKHHAFGELVSLVSDKWDDGQGYQGEEWGYALVHKNDP